MQAYPQLLAGKTGIITGALDETSIAWQTALKVHAAGGRFLLTNTPVALRLGSLQRLADETGSEIIPADATNVEELDKLFAAAEERFGKIDFLLHSIGMSLNVRKNRPYTDLNYDFLQKTYDISAVSFHKMLQVAWKREAFRRGGSVVALSYIAAQRAFPKYDDMTEAKALLESIARTFGYHFARRDGVRVNTISQSPTPTTAGSGIAGFQKMLQYGELLSPLGNATAEECADFIVVLFSDLTRKLTMQNLYHDGGFSTTGLSEALLDLLPDPPAASA
jgi:enoyl-[acyl-carrier protein] reductase I